MIKQEYSLCSSSSDNSAETAVETHNLLDDGFDKTSKKWYTQMQSIALVLVTALTMLNFFGLYLWTSTAISLNKQVTTEDYFPTADDGTKSPYTVERVYWDYDDDYLNFNLSIAQEFWQSLLPPGEGIVGLTDIEVAHLGLHHSIEGKRDPDKHIYLVAVFHQLHCLSVLRSHTIKAFYEQGFVLPEATYHHTMHCADILRQALLCAADSTLIFKDDSVQWPGDGSTITCRNFEALRSWTTQHSYLS